MIFLLLVGAGLLGAGLRVVTSRSQRTCSLESAADVVVGGLVSPILFALLSGWSVTAASIAKLDTLAEQAVAVFFVGYAISHLFVNLIRLRIAEWGAPKPAPQEDVK